MATEGQTIEIKDKLLYVDSQLVPDMEGVHYSDNRIFPQAVSTRDNDGPFQVPSGRLFVLTDNRDECSDSRHWGFIDSSDVIGKVFWIMF